MGATSLLRVRQGVIASHFAFLSRRRIFRVLMLRLQSQTIMFSYAALRRPSLDSSSGVVPTTNTLDWSPVPLSFLVYVDDR